MRMREWEIMKCEMSDCSERQAKIRRFCFAYGKKTTQNPFQHGSKIITTYWKQSKIRKNTYILVTVDNGNDPWN